MHRYTSRSVVLATAFALSLVGPRSAPGVATLPARFPAAGELVRATAVRATPDPSAPVVRRLPRFRPDHQFQIVLALGYRRGADGERWFRLSLPGQPNGARGWIPSDAVDVRPATRRIVVRLSARRLELQRVRDGRVLLAGVVAVGAPGPELPLDAASTSSRRSSRPIRSTAPSRSRRAPSRASATGPATSSGSTAPIGRSSSARPSRTAASALPIGSRAGSGGSPLPARRVDILRVAPAQPVTLPPSTFCTPSSVRQCELPGRDRPPALLEMDDAELPRGHREPRHAVCPRRRPLNDPSSARTHRDSGERFADGVARGDPNDGRTAALKRPRLGRQRAADAETGRWLQRADHAREGRGDVVAIVRLDLLRADAHDVDDDSDLGRLGDGDDGGGRARREPPEIARVRPAGALRRAERDQPRAVRPRIVNLQSVDVRRGDGGAVRDGHRPGEAATESDGGRRDRLADDEVEQRRWAGRCRRDRRCGRCGRCGRRWWCRRCRRLRRLGRALARVRERADDDVTPGDRAVHLRAGHRDGDGTVPRALDPGVVVGQVRPGGRGLGRGHLAGAGQEGAARRPLPPVFTIAPLIRSSNTPGASTGTVTCGAPRSRCTPWRRTTRRPTCRQASRRAGRSRPRTPCRRRRSCARTRRRQVGPDRQAPARSGSPRPGTDRDRFRTPVDVAPVGDIGGPVPEEDALEERLQVRVAGARLCRVRDHARYRRAAPHGDSDRGAV